MAAAAAANGAAPPSAATAPSRRRRPSPQQPLPQPLLPLLPRLRALLDHHGRLLLVGVGVLDHPVLADEALPAGLARERLLAGVETHVAPEVRLVVELLGTDVALVGLVPAVLGHVLLEEENKVCQKNGFGFLVLSLARERLELWNFVARLFLSDKNAVFER